MSTSLVIFYLVGSFAVIAGGVLVYVLSCRFRWEIPFWLLYTLIGLSAYLFFAQYFKYHSLHFYVDFSHWIQILQNIAKTWRPESLSHEIIRSGTLNYFSVHFVPFIYLFSIPFKLFPHPVTLIALNIFLMISSAIPLYKLSVLRAGNRRFALFMAALLLWYPTFQYITLYEFEMLRFSIPLVLWMLYFWEKKRTALYFLFAALAVLVREEVGLTVAMFGLYALFFERKKIKGIATAILGFGGFFVITQIVMPFFSTAENFQHVAAAGSFSQFGGTPIEMIKGIMTHPKLLLAAIMHPVKFANIGMLFLPLLFIPLLASAALIGLLANIGVGLVSDSLVHTSYMLYYVAPSVPFIFYAFLKAWPKVIARFNERGAMSALLAAVFVSNIFFGPSPISLQFWFKNIQPAPFRTQNFHYSVYHVTAHQRKAEQFVSMIPNDAVVSAQQFLHPRLFTKRGAMIFPQLTSNDGSVTAAYVFLDTTNNDLSSQSPAFVTPEEMDFVFRDNAQWEHVASDDGYVLYKRKI